MANSRHKKNAERVFKKWVADLKDKERTMKHVQGNFEELFEEMWRFSIPYEVAEQFLDEAVKEHLPSDYVAKTTYKLRQGHKKPYMEWLKDWKDAIAGKGRKSFHLYFPIPEDAPKKEKKKYGAMSAEEYNKQQKLADAFPEIDLEALRKKYND